MPSSIENGPSTSCTSTERAEHVRVARGEGLVHAGIGQVQACGHRVAGFLQHLGAFAPWQELRVAIDRDHQVVHLARRVPQQNRLVHALHTMADSKERHP